ncbi:MAG: hypothetical protein U5K81_03560 [Trueperaceae bacterium]|nr:hypothetical protein [Trueperaceae bacterium]
MHVDGALESVEEDVREVGAAAVAGGEVAGVPGEGWERAGDALPVCLVAGGAVAGVGVFAERFVPAGRLRVVFAVGRRLCVAFPFGRFHRRVQRRERVGGFRRGRGLDAEGAVLGACRVEDAVGAAAVAVTFDQCDDVFWEVRLAVSSLLALSRAEVSTFGGEL